MSIETFALKQGDTAPALTVTVSYSNGSSLLFVGATATFAMRDSTGTVLVSGPAMVNAQTLTYEWQAGDTDEPGVYLGEFTVTLLDGKVLSAPDLGFTVITVSPSHGDRPVPELPLLLDGSWVLDGTYALNGRKVPI